ALDEVGDCLVVLDNLEQLLPDAASTLHALIEATGNARLLCTSRTRLRLREEHCFELLGLSTDTTPDQWSDAARCFIHRAQMLSVGWMPAERDQAVIESIAARVDGLPLALELAAGRVQLLSVSEIDQHLAQRFELLGRGTSQDARHQTMHAAVAWSWSLLDPAERNALS